MVDLFYRNYWSLMLHLDYFESLNSMVICFGYEISPNMMGIQEGYDKNFHKKCIEYYKKFDTW